ncbi:MAG: GNAT family N-acetyltransferase [Trueperaceae bacterium]
MELKSLGLKTDLLLRSFEGEITKRTYYIAVRTPKNPGYRWGNFVIFQNLPQLGTLEKWKTIFAKEIGTSPEYNHFTFAIDGVDGNVGDISEFLEAGFELEKTVVMTASSVHPPPKLNTACELRHFQTEDWTDWIQFKRECNLGDPPEEQEPDDEGFRNWLERKASESQRMVDAGLGQWFGAYVNGQLASSLGLFVWDGLGRFQIVDTHPDFRRRGLAGTLVYHAANKGFETMGAKTLVMCADPDYVAVNIYESVGFKVVEQEMMLEWY